MPAPGKMRRTVSGPGLSTSLCSMNPIVQQNLLPILISGFESQQMEEVLAISNHYIQINVAATAILSKGGWKVTAKWL